MICMYINMLLRYKMQDPLDSIREGLVAAAPFVPGWFALFSRPVTVRQVGRQAGRHLGRSAVAS